MKNQAQRSATTAGGLAMKLAAALVLSACVSQPGVAEGDAQKRDGSNVYVLKGLGQLRELFEKEGAIAYVTAFDFKGRQYVVIPNYVKKREAMFPLKDVDLLEPKGVTAIPFKVNPDCIIIGQTGVYAWDVYCY